MHDAVHDDGGQVHLFRVDLARFGELFDLGDADPPGHRHERVEVHRGLGEHQIAFCVAAQGVHERVARGDGFLEPVPRATEFTDLLW